MSNKKTTKKLSLGGKEIVFEADWLAFQANASVTVRCEGTVVLATVVASRPNENLDYFPLQVEYVERLYAGGKIKGSRWVKREGRPSEEAVLTARMIDRSIRPLFPKDFKNETQVILTILSVDQENEPDILSAIAASAALHISDIPFQGPVAFSRVGLINEEYFINPTSDQRENSELDLTVAFNKDGVVMLEGGADQVAEKEFFGAISFAYKEGQKLITFLDDFRKEIGKKKMAFEKLDQTQLEEAKKLAVDEVEKIVEDFYKSKNKNVFEELDSCVERLKEETDTISSRVIKETVFKLFKNGLRRRTSKGQRVDGRKLDEVRPLGMEVDVLPRTHGSAIFQRGKSQALTVTTLGAPSLKQLIESAEGEESKRYIHHYFMPPYSVGDTGRIGSPSRREIGHGALAEKALIPVIPSEKDFPYTIRLVSEILSSNGSTSMASTCGSTLSLMDAGVPISSPVAGIAIGLIKEKDNYTLLTDMQGIEDFNGDMDFKVTGTKEGITAIQVDIKVDFLPLNVVQEALDRAKTAREHILKEMLKVIETPRTKVSRYAPKIVITNISVEKIGDLIGPGGKVIRKLIEETDCNIDVDDDGAVTVTGMDEDSVKKALERIDALTREVQPGEIFDGRVKRVETFGAFVEFLPGKQGLIHVSKLSKDFVKDARDVLKEGQEVKVKLLEVDDRGRYNLVLVSSE